MKRLFGLLAILVVVQIARAASTFDSLVVSPAVVTIVEDSRFPKYARVEVDLVWNPTYGGTVEWSTVNDSGEAYFYNNNTERVKAYLWGDAIEERTRDDKMVFRFNSQFRNCISVDGKLEYIDDSTKVSDTKVTLDWAGAVQRDTVFKEDFYFPSPRPNPFSARTQFDVIISVPVAAEVLLFDSKEKLIVTVIKDKRCRGIFHIPQDMSRYESGSYILKLFVEGNLIDTRKVMLLR